MKYSIFRILREWMFWALLFLSAALIIGYTLVYIENSDPYMRYWRYNVEEYSSAEDIDLQIAQNQERVKSCEAELAAEADANERKHIEENLARLRSSDVILSYLRDRVSEHPYKSLYDGMYLRANTKDSRSFANDALSVVLLFQIVAIILINSQVVNQGRTTGAFVTSFIMRGRKRMFNRQLAVSLGIFTLAFLLQIGLIGIIKPMFGQNSSNVLFVNGENVTIMSEGMEFMLNALSIYLILLFYWALLFAISQPINNVLLYSVVAFVVAAGVFVAMLFAGAKATNYIHYTLTHHFTLQRKFGEIAAVILLRLAVSCGLLWFAYRIAKKKHYSVRCE